MRFQLEVSTWNALRLYDSRGALSGAKVIHHAVVPSLYAAVSGNDHDRLVGTLAAFPRSPPRLDWVQKMRGVLRSNQGVRWESKKCIVVGFLFGHWCEGGDGGAIG